MNETKQISREVVKDRIPLGNYEGYLWYSDAEKPKVFPRDGAFTDDLETATIPFVVEGWLYDRENDKSYAIRYVDGKYLRVAYDLTLTDKQRTEYVAHDLGDIKSFSVAEYWAPEPDDHCAGMPVLRHAWTAFAGFASPKK